MPYHRTSFLIIYLLLSISTIHTTLIDLEQNSQNFVLETKKIIIPQCPIAFNPSIIRWNNRLLLSFRTIPAHKFTFTSYIGLVWLDENFSLISTPQVLNIRSPHSLIPSRIDDARLVQIGKRLYIVYSDNRDPIVTKGGFRVYVAELKYNGKSFSLEHDECLSKYEGEAKTLREKNWVPFDYQGTLLLAYSIIPHKIFRPILGTGTCNTVASTLSKVEWNWGTPLRGGTPAILDNGQYLSFFHSSKKMATLNSQGKTVNHYFMGAYTFDSSPPFTLKKISPEPVIGKEFYTGNVFKSWGSLKSVFPCGFILDKNSIWISYGKDDHEVWIAKIDKKGLMKSLVPVNLYKGSVNLSCQ